MAKDLKPPNQPRSYFSASVFGFTKKKQSKIALSTVFLSFPVESFRIFSKISIKGVSFNTVL